MCAFSFWNKLSSKEKRIMAILVFFLVAIAITIAGLLTPLGESDVNELENTINSTRNTVNSLPLTQQVSFIFGNNFMLCLIGFVPIAGPAFEFYSLYSTGLVLQADSLTYNLNPILSFFLLFILPFTWMEFLAYSIAMAESCWLTWRLIQHRSKIEVKNACLFISISALILLVAAVIEVVLNQYFKSFQTAKFTVFSIFPSLFS